MSILQTMDEELVNHIAAGEVVERPSSVLKELLENAIDSGATKIVVKAKKGGMDLVEVSDNGSGIAKEDLSIIACPHTTSKLFDVSGLAHIDTLGFRGEALASICAVSEVRLVSSTAKEPSAHSLIISYGKREVVEKASREKGTTVSVSHLFSHVPARRSFLKLPATEYRKLIETFIPHALAHPDVHFVLEHDGKIVYNLPSVPQSTPKSLHPQRLKELFPHLSLIELFYDGEGMIVGGYVGHPKHQGSKVDARYLLVNGRPVWDNGAARSVLVGASRFIVEGMKIPFFISLSIPHQYVDVNVHPRKIEVRFANPYRVYSAIESAVKRAFQDSLREDSTAGDDASAERLRPISQTPRLFRASAGDRDGDYRISGESHFRAGRSSQREIDDSLSFSKRVLQDFNRDDTYLENGSTVLEKPAFSDPMKVNVDERISARQYLNRYIVAEVQGNLYIIDQHAAAERIRFEKLKKEYDSQGIDRQGVMIPVCLSLSDTEALFVKEVLFHLESLGYECSVEKNKVTISSVPALLQNADHEKLFMQILSELQDVEPGDNTRGILQEKVRDSLLATMACHSSIRMNQKISDIEATRLVRDLFACQNAYSCPHGRPIVWRVTPSEIDERFNR